MVDSSYVAWDGNKYGGEPPEGWYLAADNRWWPEGYAPSPAEVETTRAESVGSEAQVEDIAPVAEEPVVDTTPGDAVPESATSATTQQARGGFGSLGSSPYGTEGGVSSTDSSISGVPDVSGVGLPDVSGVGLPDVPDVGVPDVGVPDVGVPDVGVPDVGLPDVPDVGVPDVPDVGVPDVPGVGVPDVSGVGVPDVSGVGVPDVSGVSLPDVPDVSVPGVSDVGVPDVAGPGLSQPSKSDFGAFGSVGSGFDQPNLITPDFGVANADATQPPAGVTPSAAATPDVLGSFDSSESAGSGNVGSRSPNMASTVAPEVGAVESSTNQSLDDAAFFSPSGKPAPASLPASNEMVGTGAAPSGSNGGFSAYSDPVESEKKSRKLLWGGLVALVLLVLLAALAWLVLGSRGDDSVAASIDQNSENIGSFNKPQEFNEAVSIFYVENPESIKYQWMVQVVGAGEEVADLEVESGQTLTSATVKIEYQEGVDDITIGRLMFESIGSDLTPTKMDQDCIDSLSGGIDFKKPLSPGDTIEGELCWAVSDGLVDEQVLAVSSAEASGAIYFELK